MEDNLPNPFPKAFIDLTPAEIQAITPETWIEWAEQRLHDAQYALAIGVNPGHILVIPREEALKNIKIAKQDIQMLKDAARVNGVHKLVTDCAQKWQAAIAEIHAKEVDNSHQTC